MTSSVSGGSNGSPRLILSSRHRHYASGAHSESVSLEGDDSDGDFSVAGTALARRVNAEQQQGPATTSVTLETEHACDIGSPDKNGPVVAGDDRNLTESGDVSPTSLHDVESAREPSGKWHQDRGTESGTTTRRMSLSGHAVKVADLARRTSMATAVGIADRTSLVAAHAHGIMPTAPTSGRPTATESTNADGGALHRTLLLEAVTGLRLRGESVTSFHRRNSLSLSPQGVSRPRKTGCSLKSYDESFDASGLSAGRVPEGHDKSKVLRSSISDAADISPSLRAGREGNPDEFSPPAGSLTAECVQDGGCSTLRAQRMLFDDYTDNSLATLSSLSSTARRPSTSGRVVVGYHGSLRQLVGPVTPTTLEGTNNLVLQAAKLPGGAFTSTVAVEGETETKVVPQNSDARPRSSWQRKCRQRSSLAQATSSSAVLVDVGERSLVSSENIPVRSSRRREITRRSSLPVTALAESLEHRRRSDLLLQRLTAVSVAKPSPSRRSCMSVPVSQWAQDTLVSQHIEGRSRLAPATRTAGGRWGWNHGRLEALLREGGTAVATSSAALPNKEIRGGGRWVLDAEPGLPGSPQDEVQYPMFH